MPPKLLTFMTQFTTLGNGDLNIFASAGRLAAEIKIHLPGMQNVKKLWSYFIALKSPFEERTANDPRLTVLTLTGKKLHIDLQGDETMHDLKLKITDLEGIPVNQQRIVFQGNTHIEDGEKLSDIGIRNGGQCHLILKLA